MINNNFIKRTINDITQKTIQQEIDTLDKLNNLIDFTNTPIDRYQEQLDKQTFEIQNYSNFKTCIKKVHQSVKYDALSILFSHNYNKNCIAFYYYDQDHLLNKIDLAIYKGRWG